MPKVVIDVAFEKKAHKLLRRHADKRTKIDKALRQLADDPRHPSLRTKKYDHAREIWQSYVEADTPAAWRIWWIWDDARPDTIIVTAYGPHP